MTIYQKHHAKCLAKRKKKKKKTPKENYMGIDKSKHWNCGTKLFDNRAIMTTRLGTKSEIPLPGGADSKSPAQFFFFF